MTRAPVRVLVDCLLGCVRVRCVPVLRYRPGPGSGPDAGDTPPEEAWRADYDGRRVTASTPYEAARLAVQP
jgi:hypothetical protein